MKEKQTFKIGDTVMWVSSGTRKIGDVVGIIPANKYPLDYFQNMVDKERYISQYGGGLARNHETYLVAVQTAKSAKSKKKLYWPNVNLLNLMK